MAARPGCLWDEFRSVSGPAESGALGLIIGRQSRGLSRTVAECATLGTMVKTIPQRDLRNQNAKVIEAVAAGESFVVTRNGIPVAELRPVGTLRRSFVPKVDLAKQPAGGHIDFKTFRADLDRLADQGL